MNRDNISMSSEESSSYNSEIFKEDFYDNNNQEKYRIYKSIIKDLKLKIISKPEETLSIEKELRKQSLFNKYNVIEYKFLVIGDHFSGKTSFCLKFAKNKFNLETKPSTQIECYLKTFILFGKELKIYLIDFNEDLLNKKNIPNNFYSDIKGVFALYDVTKIKNFEKTVKLIEELKEKIGTIIPFLLIGNKTDLENLKVVSLDDAKNKTQKLKCECKEVNCIDENSVNNIVKYFVSNIYYNDLDDIEKDKIKNDVLNKENNRINNNEKI